MTYTYITYTKDPKFDRFYLLPKVHKQLNNVPGRPVISNCGYYTESISAFSDFHLQPLAQAVKSYIKDTNDFLNKLCSLPKLPDNINIPHDEGLSALKMQLDNRMKTYISSDTLCDLAEVVLKNNIFKVGKKALKKERRTATGTKFAPPYRILLMAELEEEIVRKVDFKAHL